MAWEVEPHKGVKLMVGIPITPSFPYIHTLAQEAFDRAWKPHPTMRIFERAHGVASAREKLVDKFLASEATHLLFLDGDIVIKNDTIKRLLEADRPVVLGRYHETSDMRLPEVFHHSQRPFSRDPPIDFKKNEFFEFPQSDGEDVVLSGLGLLMLKREVFDKLEKPYFLYSSEYDDVIDDYWSVSEDFWVLLKLQNAGIKVSYYPDILVGHIGEALVEGEKVNFI